MRRSAFLIAASFFAFACQSGSQTGAIAATSDKPFITTVMADFDEPWAMTFLPKTNQALVTEKKGKLLLWKSQSEVIEVGGVPKVAYGGQGVDIGQRCLSMSVTSECSAPAPCGASPSKVSQCRD